MVPAFAAGQSTVASSSSNHEQEIADWRAQRIEGLASDEGWLTLTGLFWLEAGENRVGSGADARIRLPAGRSPAKVGDLILGEQGLEFVAEPGVEVTHAGSVVESLRLLSDESGTPTLLEIDEINFFVIERGGRFAARVRDRSNPDRRTFAGLDYFPIASDWRILGHFEPHRPPKTIPVPNVLGTVNHQPSPGRVTFEKGGERFQLDALEGSNGQLFLVFADRTSGDSTYGGGRFLYTPPPASDGTVLLDFNKAYNPPCAFTDFATCPLPPRQNRLRVEIRAGEKNFDRPHH